jgi:hypothetical protein
LSYVQADLIREALAELEVLDASNTVASEDSTKVSARLAGIVGDLIQRRLVASLSLSAIPDEIFPALVTITAQRSAELYGKPVDQKRLEEAENRLREITRLSRAGTSPLINLVLERLEAVGAGSDAIDYAAVNNYVGPVLADLGVRRIASIANEAAITAAQYPHVVTILAAKASNFPALVVQVAEAEAKLLEADRLNRSVSTPLIRGVLQQLAVWGGGVAAIDVTAVSDSLTGILASLSARNVIYIADVSSVPDAALPALTRLVAAWLAPKPMGEVIMQSERELRTLQRIGKGTGAMLRVDRALLAPRRFH